jgi:hypothetical protein
LANSDNKIKQEWRAMPEHEKNHRDFFRVNCPVLLDYVVVPARQKTPAASYFPDNENFSLLRELKRIDYDNNHLLHGINEEHRDIGAYLALVNKKLELIARNLTSNSEHEKKQLEQTVSISEGGVSFHCNEPLENDTLVALQITLLPSYIGIALYGHVMHCDPGEQIGNYLIAVNFDAMPDADRQILAKHVMQVQLEAKRRHLAAE